MKKLLAFIAALLVLGCFVYADVSVKDLGGGNVEVTFFYGNPRATEVVIAGSWTDWQNGALPMTKVEKGWEYKVTVPADTVMKYKFISDGNWTFDLKSPDSVDDGFGGKNGLVEVTTLVAAAKGGDAAAAAPKKAALKFQTWSMLGYQTKFNTVDDLEVVSSGIGLKSYWKFGGEIVPSVPVYVELAIAENDSFANLYNKGTLDLNDGVQNFGTDLLFDPIYFLNGQSATATKLGHFKTGLTTKYVEWTTGYNYAKLPPHTNVSWITVDKEWDAGYSSIGGYNVFNLGSALTQIGGVTVNATVAPNRTADRAGKQYGMFAYVNAQYGKQYVDFQYNGAYGKTFDTIFDNIYEADYIAGYKGDVGPVTIKANALVNQYGDNEITAMGVTYRQLYAPSSSDVGAVDADKDLLANFATNVQVIYSTDAYGVTAGYRARGVQANMMYVKEADSNTDITDQLGDRNHQRVWLDAFVKPMANLKVSVNPYVQMVFDKDETLLYSEDDSMLVYVKPSFELGLADMVGMDATVSGYGKVKYYTNDKDEFARGSDTAQYVVSEAGLTVALGAVNDTVKGAEILYGFNNSEKNMAFHTVIGTVKLPMDISVQAGGGYRVANADVTESDSALGLFLGASKKLSILQKPVLYTQFVYNMDPYKDFGDGQDNFKLDGNIIDRDVNFYEGAAAYRLALRWEL